MDDVIFRLVSFIHFIEQDDSDAVHESVLCLRFFFCGPVFLKQSSARDISFSVHRDRATLAAVTRVPIISTTSNGSQPVPIAMDHGGPPRIVL